LDSPIKLASRLTGKYIVEKRSFLSTTRYILKIVPRRVFNKLGSSKGTPNSGGTQEDRFIVGFVIQMYWIEAIDDIEDTIEIKDISELRLREHDDTELTLVTR
jgi:hypothetical protein